MYEYEDKFDNWTRKLYRFSARFGVKFQVWRLNDKAIHSTDGKWEDIANPKFTCPIHLYRIK